MCIYISLGTVFNNKPKIFKKIIKALGNTEYQIIISAGAAYPTLAKDNIPKNILIFPRVPQIELLPKVDLVIGHGGNNTTNETLAAGKPLIILPIGGEQRDNGSRVEYLRVGLKLDIDSFTEEELKSRVETIYKNQEFQKRAKELKAELEKTNGAKVAAKLIQRLIEKQQPLLRPKNLPLTFTLNHSPQLTAL
jgi:MGT family glycosyltransferase